MIEYRRAHIGDIHELIRLRIEFMKEAIKLDSNPDDNKMQDSLYVYFNKTLHNESFIAWLAIEDNKIVGTSGLCFYTLPPNYKNLTGNVAYIMNMYTDPAHRCRGIASHLFEKMIFESKRLGYKKIVLHATDLGKSLYLKFGFRMADNEMVLEPI